MKGSYCYIDDQVLLQYTRTLLGDQITKGTNIEPHCAVMTKLFLEELHGMKCYAGFKIKDKYVGTYKEVLTVEKCTHFFEEIVDNDADVDFVVSPVDSFVASKNKISGWGCQLKKFGHFQEEKTTAGFIKYLDKIRLRYGKTETILVIFFDGHRGINHNEVHEYLNKTDFPFQEILFIELNKDNPQEKWVLKMGMLWPIFFCNGYKAIEAMRYGVFEIEDFKN